MLLGRRGVKRAALALALLGTHLAVAIAAYVAVDPVGHFDPTQRLIFIEYLAVYCPQKKPDKPEFAMGEAAVLSRLSLKAGIGGAALVESQKCRAKAALSSKEKQ